MATIKVQKVRGVNPVTKEEIFFVRTKSMGVMSAQDLVENIEREGQIPRIYAQGVLDYLTTAVFDYMKAGLSVQVPGLGTLKLNVTSKSAKSEKDVTANLITGTRLRIYPFENTKEEMRRFKFQMVSDKAVDASEEEDEVPADSDNGGDQNGGQTGGTQQPGGGQTNPPGGPNTGGWGDGDEGDGSDV